MLACDWLGHDVASAHEGLYAPVRRRDRRRIAAGVRGVRTIRSPCSPTPASINTTPASRSPGRRSTGRGREQELRQLMDKAEQSAGGAVVNLLAYKADHVAAREELNGAGGDGALEELRNAGQVAQQHRRAVTIIRISLAPAPRPCRARRAWPTAMSRRIGAMPQLVPSDDALLRHVLEHASRWWRRPPPASRSSSVATSITPTARPCP